MAFASNDTVKAMKCIRPLVLITDITLAENRFPVSAGDRRPPLLTPGTAGDLLQADADLVAEENLGVLRLPPLARIACPVSDRTSGPGPDPRETEAIPGEILIAHCRDALAYATSLRYRYLAGVH
ncbi:hypothetical protein GCM10010392_12170 [Streptomyces clavifer]|uniref:Uncharacterized protein n=1 Tax=Streptomyces clavifer TaxID=68188 RepID=A0ABS4V212_9ACTN|nr:hypothetical protein [Streptomyces clavifer]GHA87430.1 hypothetical protein GCM10010392_12170 [Streptomyces clavifer]